MTTFVDSLHSTKEAEAYVQACEQDFQEKLEQALRSLFAGEHPRIIALSGPTCSGKTTTAGILTRHITEAGHRSVLLSIDDFFRDRKDRNIVSEEAPDYDSVRAIDVPYLAQVTGRLLSGREVLLPHYSFHATARTGYREYYPDPSDIYVFEGIQAVYPQVTALFEAPHKTIFISVTEDVRYRDVLLKKEEIRLLRRLVRDFKFRNATAEFTLHLWEGVRENEEQHIFPNAADCDVYINSFLPYELFIIAPYARKCLQTVPENSRYRAEAEDLLRKIAVFDCPYLEESLIPATSVFREFIG